MTLIFGIASLLIDPEQRALRFLLLGLVLHIGRVPSEAAALAAGIWVAEQEKIDLAARRKLKAEEPQGDILEPHQIALLCLVIDDRYVSDIELERPFDGERFVAAFRAGKPYAYGNIIIGL